MLKERIAKLLEHLCADLLERDETVSVALLATLSGQNSFLLGPAGTAKSLIAHRLSCAFETNKYFEYLMQRFSTPEEIFGPVSINELKKDNYTRKIEGFLPDANFAFLDEIWKSSPAILNTLLTIINEKKFRNGVCTETVPLLALISASNETPPSGQGLEALYDRFVVRLFVPPVTNKDNFEQMIQSRPSNSEVQIPKDLEINLTELEKWQEELHNVKLSEESLNIIHDIRFTLSQKEDELEVYISDRRWQRAAIFMKAAAYFCGRSKTNLVDTLLLRHCLWSDEDNRIGVTQIVEKVIENSGFETGVSTDHLDTEKDELEVEIQKELFFNTDIYETEKMRDGEQYFKVLRKWQPDSYYKEYKQVTFYVPISQMKTEDEFQPIDNQGMEIDWVKCNFDSQGTCLIKIERNKRPDYEDWVKVDEFVPNILFHKGDKKEEINERLVESLQTAVLDLTIKIEEVIKLIDIKAKDFELELKSPFVPEEVTKIALTSVENQQEEMQLRLKDCERLESILN